MNIPAVYLIKQKRRIFIDLVPWVTSVNRSITGRLVNYTSHGRRKQIVAVDTTGIE